MSMNENELDSKLDQIMRDFHRGRWWDSRLLNLALSAVLLVATALMLAGKLSMIADATALLALVLWVGFVATMEVRRINCVIKALRSLRGDDDGEGGRG